MVKQIVTKMAIVKKKGMRKGAVYRSPRIYLPTKLTDDSTFPFFEGQLIKIEVVGRGLVMKPVPGRRRTRGRRTGRAIRG